MSNGGARRAVLSLRRNDHARRHAKRASKSRAYTWSCNGGGITLADTVSPKGAAHGHP